MRGNPFALHPDDRDILATLCRRRNLPRRADKRARLLLAMDRRQDTIAEVAQKLDTTSVTVWRVTTRYREQGFAAIYDSPNVGRPLKEQP